MVEQSKVVNTFGELQKVSSFSLLLLLLPLLALLKSLFLVENEEHCDFKKLRSLLIRTHMLDLITTSEDSHYENYRQAQMETRKFGLVPLSFYFSFFLRFFVSSFLGQSVDVNCFWGEQ